MEEKQIDVKTMCDLSDTELSELLNGLRNIKGFDFFVNSQFKIKNGGDKRKI